MTIVGPKLYKALTVVAQAMVEVETLAGDGPLLPADNTKARKAYDRANGALEALMCGYASDAELRWHMTPWMVDFTGREPIGDPEMGVDERKMRQAILADFGVLPKRISDWLRAQGYQITDSGGGLSGWHLGVPCTDAEATQLCTLAHQEFRTFIESDLLAVQLWFRRWSFTRLRTYEDAKEFLRTKGVS